jgi:uncharacterized repeat protein (TIGR01451 family)
VSTATPESTTVNNTTSAVTSIGTLADVSVTLSVPSTGTAGQTATGTVTFTNNGPSPATAVQGTVSIAGGTLTAIAGGTLAGGNGVSAVTPSLAPGATVSYAFTFIAGAAPAVTTTARVATTSPETATANNATTATTALTSIADVSVTLSLPATATAGQMATGTVTFTNNGPSTAATVTGTVTLGAGTITAITSGAIAGTSTGVVPVGSLSAGAMASYTFTYTVAATGTVSATATAATATPESTLANNVATASSGVNSLADVSVTISMPASGTAGTAAIGTITFTSNGPSAASNVTGTVSLTAGTLTAVTGGTVFGTGTGVIIVGSLPAGGNASYTFTFAVPSSSSVSATGTVGTSTPESTTANNVSIAGTGVTLLADLRITITAPATASPAATITATVAIGNTGPSAALNVTATVTLPNGSNTSIFALSSLPAGSTTSVVVSYSVPGAQTSTMNWFAAATTTTPEVTTANNTATAVTNVTTLTNAALSGRVWLDFNENRVWNQGVDTPLGGYRVEVFQGSTQVGTATTNVDGLYSIAGLVPGGGYSLRFREPNGNVVLGTPFNQATNTTGGNASTGGPQLLTAQPSTAPISATAQISNITLYAGDNVVEQNLPLDPSGIVYDSVTRLPIAGATVRLTGPAGFDPAIHTVGGTDQFITGELGAYQYLFVNNPPNGVYTLQITAPTGYAPAPAAAGGVAPPQGTLAVPPGVTFVQPQNAPPPQGTNGLPGTAYYFSFNWDFGAFREVRHNHIPLDPLVSGAILVNKTGNKTVAEIGDSVQYTIRMRNTTAGPIAGVVLDDMLPAGFRYILETARLNGAVVPNPAGGVGRALAFPIGVIPANTTYELTYFVRLGVGSQQGDGINRATASFPGVGGVPVRSNTAAYKVTVQGGVFSNDGCIAGKVYVDCDGNGVQNNDGGSREVGIPGVRLVMLDGTWIVTDNEGKYSICGVKPQTHVIKVDRTTLPKGSRLVPSSNRNAGVGDSLFVDMKGGELHRADFIEGSCSPDVMDQVKARRAQGAPAVPETEGGKPLTLQGPGGTQQQILPAPRQADILPGNTGTIR